MTKPIWCVETYSNGAWWPIENSVGYPYRELCKIAKRMYRAGERYRVARYWKRVAA